MIYITQLIFIKEGQEETFHEFESHAIPLLEKHNGKIVYRIRPSKETFIDSTEKQPYEIHFISFVSDQDLNDFMKDQSRLKFIHLKNHAVESTLLVKGEKM